MKRVSAWVLETIQIGMSGLKKPLMVLGATLLFAGGAAFEVHRLQAEDKKRMHRQVLRDIEEEQRIQKCKDEGSCFCAFD